MKILNKKLMKNYIKQVHQMIIIPKMKNMNFKKLLLKKQII